MEAKTGTDQKIFKGASVKVWVVFFVIVYCIVLISITFFPYFPSLIRPEQFWRMKAQDVENHRQQWKEHRITKYQIGVHFATEYMSFPGGTTFSCSQELLVDHETIIQKILNSCGDDFSLTVDGLFSIIAEKVGARLCDPEGCKCGPLVVDVTYDSTYYLPRKTRTFYDSASSNIFRVPGENYCMGIGGNATQGITLNTYLFKPVP